MQWTISVVKIESAIKDLCSLLCLEVSFRLVNFELVVVDCVVIVKVADFEVSSLVQALCVFHSLEKSLDAGASGFD